MTSGVTTDTLSVDGGSLGSLKIILWNNATGLYQCLRKTIIVPSAYYQVQNFWLSLNPNNTIIMKFRKYEFGSKAAATTKINALGVR